MKDKLKIGAVVLVSILLIFIGKSDSGIKLQLKLSNIFSPLESYTSFFFNTFRIRHENKILRQKAGELALENQLLYNYKVENSEFRELLRFRDQAAYALVPANIVNRDLDPVSEVCTVDKGIADGMRIGLPVITEQGVYGKVIEVTSDKALIQTLFNFNFRVSGIDVRSGEQGIVRWESGRGFILEHMPVNSNIQVGDIIITSGLGSVFPRGLNIGTVKKISIDPSKLYYSINLVPACQFTKVTNVFVLKESAPLSTTSPDSLIETSSWQIVRTKPDTSMLETSTENELKQTIRTITSTFKKDTVKSIIPGSEEPGEE